MKNDAIVLSVKNLCKKYPNFCLDNVSFELQAGKIYGFIGANGAGKSTTLKAIMGLIHSEKDQVLFWGKSMQDSERSIKNRLGIVLDDGYFYESLTINEMKSVIAPVYDNWSEESFQKLLERFSLSKKQKISTLSKGMKMKFSIAMALAHQAELIIMDEPTSGLDPMVRNDLMELLRSIVNETGCCLLFSTHIISDLEKIADEVIFINGGKIIFQKEKNALLQEYQKVIQNDHLTIEDIMLYHAKGENWDD